MSISLCSCSSLHHFSPQPVVYSITESEWKRARFLLFGLLLVCRHVLARKHLQSFLHSAKSVIMSMHRRSAVSGEILRVKLTSQYTYLCVATLQYLAPLLCFGYLGLLILRKGQLDFGICAAFNMALTSIGLPESVRRRSPRPFPIDASLFPVKYQAMVTNITATATLYSNHKVLTPSFYGPVLDFLVWWCCSAWFCLSLVGFLYWRTIPEAYGMAGAANIRKDKTTKPKKKNK